MNLTSIVGHGVSGAVTASLYHVVGAAVLKASGHDQYVGQVGNAAIEALVGGAIVHGGLGLISAMGPPRTLRDESGAYATSGVVSALTGGVTGTAVLTATHHASQLTPVQALAAGATGLGVITGGVVALGLGCVVAIGVGAAATAAAYGVARCVNHGVQMAHRSRAVGPANAGPALV